jgi:hypothetical protein
MWHRFRYTLGVFLCYTSEKPNLFAIAAAPFAQNKVQAQPETLWQRQRPIERCRLKFAGLPAGRNERAEP